MKTDFLTLTDIMNEIRDAKNLEKFSNEVFNGVTPLRNRDKFERLVSSSVALLAAGMDKEEVTKALFDAQDLMKDKLWVYQMIERVLEIAENRTQQRVNQNADISTSLRLALSYSAVNDARDVPTEELTERASGIGFEKAGHEAMLDVMRFLSNPQAYDLTPETVRLTHALGCAIEHKARRLSGATGDQEVTSVDVNEAGEIQITLDDGAVVNATDSYDDTLGDMKF